eukprot:5802982-Amphidinium_carterae.1
MVLHGKGQSVCSNFAGMKAGSAVETSLPSSNPSLFAINPCQCKAEKTYFTKSHPNLFVTSKRRGQPHCWKSSNVAQQQRDRSTVRHSSKQATWPSADDCDPLFAQYFQSVQPRLKFPKDSDDDYDGDNEIYGDDDDGDDDDDDRTPLRDYDKRDKNRKRFPQPRLHSRTDLPRVAKIVSRHSLNKTRDGKH